MIGASLQAAQSATKTRYFTAPDGTRYKWTKQTEPTQADIDAIVNYHTQTVAPAKKAVKEGGKKVADTLTGMFGAKPAKNDNVTSFFQSQNADKKTTTPVNPKAIAAADKSMQIANRRNPKGQHLDSKGNVIPDYSVQTGIDISNASQKAIAEVIKSATNFAGGVIGEMSGANRVPGGKALAEKLTTDAVAGLINTPINIAANAGNMMFAKDNSIENVLKSAGNLAVDLLPVEALPGVKAIKRVFKSGDAIGEDFAKALGSAEGSGLPKRPLTDVPQYNPKRVPTEPKPVSEPSVTAPKATKEPVQNVTGGVKEPWQMTLEEYKRSPLHRKALADGESSMLSMRSPSRLPDNSMSTSPEMYANDWATIYERVELNRRLGKTKVEIDGKMVDAASLSEKALAHIKTALDGKRVKPASHEWLASTEQRVKETLDAHFNPTHKGPMGGAFSHYVDVRNAIESGKPVPSKVLNDYPELAKKYNGSGDAYASPQERFDVLYQQAMRDAARLETPSLEKVVRKLQKQIEEAKTKGQDVGHLDPQLKAAQDTLSKQPTPNTPKPVEAPQKPVQAPETASVMPPNDGKTGVSMYARTKDAETYGTTVPESIKGATNEEAFNAAKKRVAEGENPETLLESLASGKRPASQDEVASIAVRRGQLIGELNDLRVKMDAGDTELRKPYDKLLERIETFDNNLDIVKAENGRALNALKIGNVIDTGNFAEVMAEVKRGGAKVNPKMEQQLRDMTEKAKFTEAKLAETERLLKEEQAKRTTASQTKKSPRFSKEELDAELDSLLKEFGQKTAKLSAGIDPELLPIMGKIAVNYMKRGVNTLDEVVAAVQSHFKDATYEDVMDGIDAATKDMPRTKSQIQSEMAKMKRAAKSDVAARKQIAEWQHQLDTGNYEVPTKRERVVSKRLEDLRAEREILHREVLGRIKDAATPLGTKVLREGSALVRGAVLGSDMGQLTRQGLFAWSRPKNALKGLVNASRAVVSEKNLVKIERDMQMARVNGELAQPIRNKAGLQLTHSIINPEEIVVGRLLQKIPVLGHLAGKPLERAQLAFINTVRTEMFDYGIKHGFTPAELKLRAQFINSVTGRSNVKAVPDLLAAVMTSPRYEISRWETLAAPLKNAGALGKDLVTKKGLNKAALANIQDMAVTAGGIYGMFKMSELAGYSVNFDPKSGDFLKMRKGNEVWDISAGLAPRLRDILRAYVYTTDPSYNKNLGDVIRGSVTRTISPSVRVPTNIASTEYQKANGRTVGGKGDKAVIDPISGFPIGEFDEGFQTFLPLIIQSMRQALKDEGPGAAASAGMREFIGGGVNRYPEKKPKP